jgi:hypothetical protein
MADVASAAGILDPVWAARITLVDREGTFLDSFARNWRQRYGFPFPETNLLETDVVTRPPDRRFDVVVGNPPWVSYPELDPEDQERYRPWFRDLNLVGRPSELLLGRSRLDVAALVTARAFSLVKEGGRAGFFLPLSLFHSGSAARWRRWVPDTIFDLSEARVFPEVGTRYGWAEFSLNQRTRSPRYFTGTPEAWVSWDAVQDAPEAPWRLVSPGTKTPVPQFPLAADQRPRQGINTGGANAAYHVAAPPPGVDPSLVHPLVRSGKPEKWIVVPYQRDGSILEEAAVVASGLAEFWVPWKERLAARRGLYLGSQFKRGRWWALLGVGAYAFAPYKVLWSAYGQTRLEPRVWGPRSDDRVWQADQALQAYIPCPTRDQADQLAAFLGSDAVHGYLASFRDAGTRSWAQPGRLTPLWMTPPEDGTPEGTNGS